MRFVALVAGFLLWAGGASAQCVGPAGVPFNCAVGTTPALTDVVQAGSTTGVQSGHTIRYTLSQVLGLLQNPAFTTLTTTGNATVGGTLNGINIIGGTLSGYSGNTFLGAEQNSANFTGTESTFIGDRAGGAVGSGDFNFSAGHDATGIGGGCANIFVNASTVTGTDALRNTCGHGGAAGVDAYGAGALKTYNQAGTSSNNYLTGTAAFGANSLFYWNAPVPFPWNTAVGNSACAGASSGTVSFTNGTCVGSNTGKKLTTATNFVILSGGGNGSVGSTTFASGSAVILIGSGAQTVDTPLAGTTGYINLENVLTFSGTGTPSTSIATIAGVLNVAGAINGAPLSGGTLAGNGGNTFLGAEQNLSGLTGTETTFVGDRAGGAFTGASSFNTAVGHDSCGIGSGAGGATGGSNLCVGADAGRNLAGTINGVSLAGADAGYHLSATSQSISGFGASSMYNLTAPIGTGGFDSALGAASCQGAAGATFIGGTCLGANTGGALTSAQNFLIAGLGVGNTTFASGSGVILLGSGAQAVDTPLAGTSNYINIENILTVTGTNTPSTSVAQFAGLLNVVGAYQANGTAGVTCAGSPTSSFASTNGIVTHC